MEKSLEQVAGDAQGVATALREILKKHTALTDQAIATVERDTEIQRLKTDLARLTDRLTKSTTSNTQLAQQLTAARETIAQNGRDLQHAIDKQNLLQNHLDTAKSSATVVDAVESKDREATVVANTRRQCREDNDAAVRVILEDRDKLRGERDCKAAELKLALTNMTSRTPVAIGSAGEKEIDKFLTQVFAGFLHVRHVGNIGQGHLLDLEVTTNDDSVRIHIDCKDYATTHLPPGEMDKFNKDLDRIQPHAGIIFMRPQLRGTNLSVQRLRRGSVIVFHVGFWNRNALIQCIHEAIIQHKVEKEIGEVHRRPFQGAPEVSAAFVGMCDLIELLNKNAAAVAEAIKDSVGLGVTKNYAVAEQLAAAHSVNLHAVPKTVLDKFIAQLPKRKRGAPSTKSSVPAAKRKRGGKSSAPSPLAIEIDGEDEVEPDSPATLQSAPSQEMPPIPTPVPKPVRQTN